jgi:hypothetical protein
MSNEQMGEIENLAAALERMGAPAPQARTMARQLLKRAEQIAAERDIAPVEALAYLLKLTQSGREGEVDPEAFAHRPSPPEEK